MVDGSRDFFSFDLLCNCLDFICLNLVYCLLLLTSCSSLFPDVVNCMQTDNLELKKLVYLYLMNYAKSQPDLAILAVNTFAKVTSVDVFI